ncbi:Short transient receptor putative channel 4-associated protein [Sparganum proliferum]
MLSEDSDTGALSSVANADPTSGKQWCVHNVSDVQALLTAYIPPLPRPLDPMTTTRGPRHSTPRHANNPRGNRWKRKTALVARELARHKVDITTLGENEFFEQSRLEEGAPTEKDGGRLGDSQGRKIQGHANHNELNKSFAPLKTIYDYPTKGTAPLLNSGGTKFLMEKSQISKRWAEHFRRVFNRSSTTSDAAVDRLPEVETNDDLDLPPSLPEKMPTVHRLSSGKAPGSDGIPVEAYKRGGPRVMD